mgnify:CR=1 FL=1
MIGGKLQSLEVYIIGIDMNKTIEKILEIWGGNSFDNEHDPQGLFSTLAGLEKQLEHEPSVIVAMTRAEDGSITHQIFEVEYD